MGQYSYNDSINAAKDVSSESNNMLDISDANKFFL